MAETVQSSTESAVRWTEVVPISLTAGGLLLFGLATIPISRFYEEFGLNPGDVGLDWASTLTRSNGLVIVVITIATTTTTIALSCRAKALGGMRDDLTSRLAEADAEDELLKRKYGAAIPLEERSRVTKLRDAANDKARRTSRRINGITLSGGILSLVVVFLVLDLALIWVATSRAADLREGRRVEPVRLATLTLLPLEGSPAEVEWALPPNSRPATLRGFLLGETAGVTTVFDPATGKTHRFPTSTALVTLTE